jgi:hypothetical protein
MFPASIFKKPAPSLNYWKEIQNKGIGAEERTRTSTPLRVLHPECSASANSATSARNRAAQLAVMLL